MPEEVFLDASFWVDFMLREQSRHQQARDLWNDTINEEWHRVTTNWTLYEALTLINSRRVDRHDLALDLLELVSITTDVVDATEFENQALSIFRSHDDKRWSVVDCANFVCIRERQSNWALSFDRDFAQAQNEFGFTLLGAGAGT